MPALPVERDDPLLGDLMALLSEVEMDMTVRSSQPGPGGRKPRRARSPEGRILRGDATGSLRGADEGLAVALYLGQVGDDPTGGARMNLRQPQFDPAQLPGAAGGDCPHCSPRPRGDEGAGQRRCCSSCVSPYRERGPQRPLVSEKRPDWGLDSRAAQPSWLQLSALGLRGGGHRPSG